MMIYSLTESDLVLHKKDYSYSKIVFLKTTSGSGRISN